MMRGDGHSQCRATPNRQSPTEAPLALTDHIEEWRGVVGAARYEVSSLGRLRGPKGLFAGSGDRYLVFTVRDPKPRPISVHVAVMAAFCGPRPAGMQVDHINGDRRDNRLANLRYLSPRDNTLHSVALGTHPCGERNGWSKLTATAVAEIRATYRPRHRMFSGRALARKFGVSQHCVWQVLNQGTWR